MPPNPHSLTVVIVAKNEQRNITQCIAGASFADEVLVLDSGSSDATVRLAQEAGARVVQTDWPGYGPQVARGFALALVDVTTDFRAGEYVDVLEVIRHMRSRDNVPTWMIGGSDSTGLTLAFAAKLPLDQPMGAVFYSPFDFSAADAGLLKRPTLVVSGRGGPLCQAQRVVECTDLGAGQAERRPERLRRPL